MIKEKWQNHSLDIYRRDFAKKKLLIILTQTFRHFLQILWDISQQTIQLNWDSKCRLMHGIKQKTRILTQTNNLKSLIPSIINKLMSHTLRSRFLIWRDLYKIDRVKAEKSRPLILGEGIVGDIWSCITFINIKSFRGKKHLPCVRKRSLNRQLAQQVHHPPSQY